MNQKKNEKIEKKSTIIHKKNIKDDLKEKETKYKKLKKDFLEEQNKLLRNIADLQNQLKRNEKNFSIEKNKIKKKYLIQIVDILDLLKNAYKDKNPKKGLKLIINNIENVLKDEKIKYINCVGKTFDHKIHHAITTIEKENCKENIILDELKKGYFINDEILRHSEVIVSKKSD